MKMWNPTPGDTLPHIGWTVGRLPTRLDKLRVWNATDLQLLHVSARRRAEHLAFSFEATKTNPNEPDPTTTIHLGPPPPPPPIRELLGLPVRERQQGGLLAPYCERHPRRTPHQWQSVRLSPWTPQQATPVLGVSRRQGCHRYHPSPPTSPHPSPPPPPNLAYEPPTTAPLCTYVGNYLPRRTQCHGIGTQIPDPPQLPPLIQSRCPPSFSLSSPTPPEQRPRPRNPAHATCMAATTAIQDIWYRIASSSPREPT